MPFKHVELEINTACDLSCFGCDRFSDVTTAPNMTVRQVERFLAESVALNWPWERIRFLGGEPTLHPQFTELVTMLCRYRDMHRPTVFLQVLSNGRGKIDRYRSWLIENRVSPHVESKDPGVTPQWFANTRIAPVDHDVQVGELEPCGIFGPHGCGVGLTRNGFFLDGAGASVARVAGIDCGVMALKDVTWQAMMDQAKVLCRICGHWNPMNGPGVTKKVTETGEVTGLFWTERLKRFKEERPVLRVYGEA